MACIIKTETSILVVFSFLFRTNLLDHFCFTSSYIIYISTHSTKTIREVGQVRNRTGKRELEEHDMGLCVDLRHGATMHGPKPRSHAIKLQKKVRRLGLKIALSARTAEGKFSRIWQSLASQNKEYCKSCCPDGKHKEGSIGGWWSYK
ncbi:unnamed protein product [Musa acuminata subsp. burmannicoides]